MNAKFTLIALMSLSFAGVLTAAEMDKQQGKNIQQPAFSVFDLNNDNRISEDEFNQGRSERIQQRTEEQRMLKNIDQAPNFKQLDGDADGFISQEEFQLHQQSAVTNKTQTNTLKKSKSYSKNMQSNMANMQRPLFKELDGNNDQQVTEEEFAAFRAKRIQERSEEGRLLKNAGQIGAFSSFDTDKDGVISEEEFILHQRAVNPNKGSAVNQ